MKIMGDEVRIYDFKRGKNIEMMEEGDEEYEEMIGEIGREERRIVMEKYILENEEIGKKFEDEIGDEVKRGVEVRVMVDEVGESY